MSRRAALLALLLLLATLGACDVETPPDPAPDAALRARPKEAPCGRTLVVPAAMASDPAGTTSKLSSAVGAHSGWMLTGAAKLTYPLALDEGERVTGWRLLARKASPPSGTLYGSLYSVDATNVETPPVGVASSSAGAPGIIWVGATGLGLDVVVGRQVYLVVGSDAAGGGDRAFHAEVDVAWPRAECALASAGAAP